MVGGGNRKDDGSLGLNSTNVFAALGSLKKKKKSEKESSSSSRSKGVSKKAEAKEQAPVFWAPTPLTAKSWADVDDEDDDDYYATTAPPQSVWGTVDPPKVKESVTPLEESESEDEGIDEVDDDNEEDHEHEHEHEVPVEKEPITVKPPVATLPSKDTERQLSKKELKKKGLEELDAVLAELGLIDSRGQDESQGAVEEKKAENLSGELEKKENAPGESKTAKKKKKKDKASKETKEPQDQPNDADEGNGTTNETAESEKADDASTVDMKERLKKMASMKKKKSSKEMDAAAKAAASEAAARSARLAAAKKKEKNHYNQQPVR